MIFLKILGLIWALPATLLALPFIPYNVPIKARFRNWGLEFVCKRVAFKPGGGQTWGNITFFVSEKKWNHPVTVPHEERHRFDAMIGGIFFLIGYVLAGFLAQAKAKTIKNWRDHWYKENWFERRAHLYAREIYLTELTQEAEALGMYERISSTQNVEDQ